MAKEQWVVTTKKADFNAMGQQFGISPMLARIIRNRDVITQEEVNLYLNGTPEQMHDPCKMRDMEKGAYLLLESIKESSEIMMWMEYVRPIF